MDDNELRYIREHGIKPEDEAAFRRMDKYYYFLDAFMWCEDNEYGCDYDLAVAMSEYVEDNYDSNMTHWDNFEAAYNACRED